MKAKIYAFLTAIVLLSLNAGAFAQEGVRLGFIAQPMSTWLLNKADMEAPEDEFTYEKTWGMLAGPQFGYNFTSNLGLRIGILYGNQGQNWRSKLNDSTWVHHTQRLAYLKMPIMFGYNTSLEFHKVAFSGYAGIQGGLRLRSRYYNDDQSYTPDEVYFGQVTNYPSETQQYRTFTYGAVANAGVDVKLTYNLVASAHLRGEYDLSDAEYKDANFQRIVNGIPTTQFIYDQERPKTHNLTAGIMLGLTYVFSDY